MIITKLKSRPKIEFLLKIKEKKKRLKARAGCRQALSILPEAALCSVHAAAGCSALLLLCDTAP